MDEMLNEVFDDLVASEDQDTIANPHYIYDVPPNDGQHTFNWNDAIHYSNINGLQEAREYKQDSINDPSLSYLMGEYDILLNKTVPPIFNNNTCN